MKNKNNKYPKNQKELEKLIIHPEIIKTLNNNGFVIMRQAQVQQIINKDLELAKELIENYGSK